MSVGLGNIKFSNPPGSGGGGGTVTGAVNGVSLKGTNVVLGNDRGDATIPAALTSNRSIPLQGYGILLDWEGSGSGSTSFLQVTSGGTAFVEMYKGLSGQQLIEIVTIQGQNPGINPYGNFWVTLDETFINSDGQRDAVLQWGYNQNGSGGVQLANEAAIWWSMESAFENIPSDQFEIELQSVAKNGNVNRHLQLDVNKEDGNAVGTWTAGNWEWFNDNTTSVPYFGIGGGASSMFLQGTQPSFQMIATVGTTGQLSITTNSDGSVNISNSTSGSNPVISVDNAFQWTTWNTANAAINLDFPNVDSVKGIQMSGSVSNGSGTAYTIYTQIDATGGVGSLMENLDASGYSSMGIRTAVGGGPAQIQFADAAASKVFSLGLLQSSGHLVISNGTLANSGANMFTMTPAAQAGFGGQTAPTAFIHAAPSPGTAGTSPLKLTAGTLLPAPEDGAVEYDGTHLYFTIGATRHILI